jgi:hypothetical protein
LTSPDSIHSSSSSSSSVCTIYISVCSGIAVPIVCSLWLSCVGHWPHMASTAKHLTPCHVSCLALQHLYRKQHQYQHAYMHRRMRVVRSKCALNVFVSACCDGMLLYCNEAHSSGSAAALYCAPILSHLTSTHAQLISIHVVYMRWPDSYGRSKCTLLAISMCRRHQIACVVQTNQTACAVLHASTVYAGFGALCCICS